MRDTALGTQQLEEIDIELFHDLRRTFLTDVVDSYTENESELLLEFIDWIENGAKIKSK